MKSSPRFHDILFLCTAISTAAMLYCGAAAMFAYWWFDKPLICAANVGMYFMCREVNGFLSGLWTDLEKEWNAKQSNQTK